MKRVLLLVSLACALTSCSRWDDTVTINRDDLRYFRNTYGECRERFLSQARSVELKYPDARLGSYAIPSATDRDLYMDYLYIPARKTRGRVLVVSAGLHGIEGYGGSAVLDLFMSEFLPVLDLRDTGVVILHGINAYGMKHYRRCTEGNVDLNRNGSLDGTIYGIENRGYAALREILEPRGRLRTGWLSDAAFFLRLLRPYVSMPRRILAEAVAAGQYGSPQGLFYGGKGLEPQLREVRRILSEIIPQYARLVNIDLHTAYGKRGNQHILMYALDLKRMAVVQSVFAGHHIDWSSSDAVYAVHGNFSDFLHALCPEKPRLTLFFEYGTVDSQTMGGAIATIKTLTWENQGRRFGYARDEDAAVVRNLVDELFYPSSPAWRSTVIARSRVSFKQLAAGWETITGKEFFR